MSTMTELQLTLTREDVRAMRKAGAVTFHHNEGEGRMKLVLTTFGENKVWTKSEQELFPEVAYNGRERERLLVGIPSTITNYGPDSTTEDASCFEMVHAAHFVIEWSTTASSVKVGDKVTLRWTASNNAEIHREVGFHNDELRMEVDREVKGKRQRLGWLISVACRPNNSARMVRPQGV